MFCIVVLFTTGERMSGRREKKWRKRKKEEIWRETDELRVNFKLG
jgi:hypothetical protein